MSGYGELKNVWIEMKMLKNALITNNLIAIAVYILIGLLAFFSLLLFFVAPPILLLMIIPHTLIVLGLYFLAGRLFLRNTKNASTDFISVAGLATVIIAVTFLAYADLWGDLWADLLSWGSLFLLPFFSQGFILTGGSRFALQIPTDERIFIFMFLSLLAPLAMWTGLRAKQYVSVSALEIQQPTSKNKLLSVLGSKKKSFILFIALIFLIYLPIILILILVLFVLMLLIIEMVLGFLGLLLELLLLEISSSPF